MSYIRGALLAGRFRSWRELEPMTHEDQRNTLITELAGRTAQSVPSLQAMNDPDLAGAGLLFVLMRHAAIRDEATLRTLTIDDQRNILIVELGAITGMGSKLQAHSNLGLVRIAMTGSGGVRGALLAGGFRTWSELNTMSADDQRNTLITCLVSLCRQDVGFFQGMDDVNLAGCGGMTVILRDAGIRDAATLATMSADDQRNTLISEVAAFTGLGKKLQGRSNAELVRIALGDNLARIIDHDLEPFRDVEPFKPDIVVRYRGLRCYGETDWDGDPTLGEDEPYVAMVVSAHDGSAGVTTQVYTEVDAGDTRPDLIEIYRGKAYGLGINLVLNEHDFSDPAKMEQLVKDVAAKVGPMIGAGLAAIPVVGLGLAGAFEWVWAEYGDEIVDEINDLFDFGDDVLGEAPVLLTGPQLRAAATQGWQEHNGLQWKFESPLISGQGASYKAVFDVVIA